ncbi:MAG: DUF3822 family protein [Bacteroidales bacterium]|nr:DUF3822 family protein [Bacteroidales bacterium]
MESVNTKETGISIQVSLSGYSFKVSGSEGESRSEWLPAGRIFTTPEFQRRYSSVEISLFTPKVTLVPESFFSAASAREALSEVSRLRETDYVEYVPVPRFGAVMVYSNSIGESLSETVARTVFDTSGNTARVLPELWFILRDLQSCPDYNKILCSWMDGWLFIAVAQGSSLLLANVFEAADFTTAEYFIFLAMKRLQLNPEVSSICFRTPLEYEQEMSLYRYFKSVEQL